MLVVGPIYITGHPVEACQKDLDVFFSIPEEVPDVGFDQPYVLCVKELKYQNERHVE